MSESERERERARGAREGLGRRKRTINADGADEFAEHRGDGAVSIPGCTICEISTEDVTAAAHTGELTTPSAAAHCTPSSHRTCPHPNTVRQEKGRGLPSFTI
eukprot:2326658-Rhodomonas_salina.2